MLQVKVNFFFNQNRTRQLKLPLSLGIYGYLRYIITSNGKLPLQDRTYASLALTAAMVFPNGLGVA